MIHPHTLAFPHAQTLNILTLSLNVFIEKVDPFFTHNVSGLVTDYNDKKSIIK